MDCPKCGARNPDDAGYCSLCLEIFETGAIDASEVSPGHSGLDSSASVEERVTEASSVSVEPAMAEPSPPETTGGFRDEDLGSLEEILKGEPITESLSEHEVMPFATTPPPGPSDQRHVSSRTRTPGGATVKLAGVQPEYYDTSTLLGFAVAVGVAGAVIYRIATWILARYAAVAIATAATRPKMIVYGILFTLGFVFGLSFLVGWKAFRLGAVLGSVTVLVLCVVEGALSAMGIGAASTVAEGVNFNHYLAFYATMVCVGAFGGWLGEAWKTDKDVGGWSFDKTLTLVGGSACVLLFLVAIGGLILGGGVKPTDNQAEEHQEKHAAELVEVFEKMNQHKGWQADITGESGWTSIAYQVLYQKGVGYLVSSDIDSEGNQFDTEAHYAVLPNGEGYEYEKHVSYRSSPQIPSTPFDVPVSSDPFPAELEEALEEEYSDNMTEYSIRDSPGEFPYQPTRPSYNIPVVHRWDRTTKTFAHDLFNPDLVDVLIGIEVTKGSFRDQDCICFQASGNPLNLPGFTGPNPPQTKIWVSGETGEVRGIEILQAESAWEEEAPVEYTPATAHVKCVFSRMDEKVLENNAFFP